METLKTKKTYKPKISFAITACTESKELDNLLELLIKHWEENDEIIILCDEGNTTPEVINVIEKYRQGHEKNIHVFYHALAHNFSAHKNYLNSVCQGKFIFNIDADELPSDQLLDNIHLIIETNPSVDLYWVARANYVEGITLGHLQKWHWTVNDKGFINWPDWQGRIYKNTAHIHWVNKVHEHLEGFKNYTFLPQEDEYALIHRKTIETQEKQNESYDKIIKSL